MPAVIHPAKPAASLAPDFIVTDIENDSTGAVLAIGVFDGTTHHVFYDWETWLDWIGKRAQTDTRFRTVYAHNGGRWDWLSLLEWMVKNDRFDSSVVPVCNNNDDILAVFVTFGKVRVRLCDSVLLLKASLDDAGKKYTGRGKMDLGGKLPAWYWRHDRVKFWEYLRGDCETLYQIMVRVYAILFQIAPISRVGLTVASVAMRVWRTGFLRDPIDTPSGEVLREWLRSAYCGGRVEVFRPGTHRVNVYDINSMYPAIMESCSVPTSGTAIYTERKHFDRCGVYHVRFDQTDRRKPPLLMVGGNGVYSGEGFYFTPELRRFPGTIDVLGGFVFDREGILFREFVRRLYKLRLTDRKGPLGELTKYCMNGLYGKFAQKPERARVLACDYADLCDHIAMGHEPVTLSEEWGIYKITERAEVPFEHVGIAGIITSEARGRLWDFFDSKTVYCDTDSIHTTGKLKVEDAKLGGLKLEFSGEGVYAGKKLYSLRNAETWKVRAKGIRISQPTKDSKRNDLGAKLTYADLLRVAAGSKIVCRFKSATTANAVFRGEASCRFRTRSRTIRKTANGIPRSDHGNPDIRANRQIARVARRKQDRTSDRKRERRSTARGTRGRVNRRQSRNHNAPRA